RRPSPAWGGWRGGLCCGAPAGGARPPPPATTITLLEPVVATVLAVVVVGERLTSLGWFGIALILAGVAIIATATRETATRTGSGAASVDLQT
ncbi:MAG: EamA family transporter, partial [Microbacteriaceae bacterium]|nr:EamA family transporter [Microbacteriaceae bacterium]